MNGERIGGSEGRIDAQQAEECCYRYLKIGGGMLLGGLCLMLVAFLFPVGVLLAAGGGAVIVGDIVWSLRLRNQQGINVTCPSCEKEYNVLPGSHTFMCDDCKHAVPVPRVA